MKIKFVLVVAVTESDGIRVRNTVPMIGTAIGAITIGSLILVGRLVVVETHTNLKTFAMSASDLYFGSNPKTRRYKS